MRWRSSRRQRHIKHWTLNRVLVHPAKRQLPAHRLRRRDKIHPEDLLPDRMLGVQVVQYRRDRAPAADRAVRQVGGADAEDPVHTLEALTRARHADGLLIDDETRGERERVEILLPREISTSVRDRLRTPVNSTQAIGGTKKDVQLAPPCSDSSPS